MAAFNVWANAEPNLRHPAILTTAWVAFALWAGAVGLMLQAKPGEWAAGAVRFRVTQWTWALGCAMFLIHVAVAFHFAHRWQHANAFQHVQNTSDFGPGIFVSYFFTLLWTADAIWMTTRPTSYVARPRWLGWAVHGFMAFITFNGTAVFGHGLMQWVSVGVFAVLGWYLVMGKILPWHRRAAGDRGCLPRRGNGE
jgi:prepilin signal peptidase PulO-like enzyme (type II secretory pathway)